MERPRPSRPVVVALLLLALSPVIAVVLSRFGVHYLPVTDQATIDLRVRDVFTANPPLVGAYSRGFDHPGPILFWLLAPLSAAAGGAAWATLVGGALLQGLAIVGVGLVALRRGGVACMMLMLATMALVYAGLPTSGQFIETWNPYVALPCFVLYLLLVWSVGVGDHRLVLAAVIVATVLVQLHIGYLPLVVAAALWAMVVGVLAWRRRDPTFRSVGAGAWLRAFVWSAVALALLWIAPVIQQLTGRPGNLTAIWDYFTSGAPSAGIATGAGLFAAQFKVVPPWLGGDDPLRYGTGTVAPASLLWLAIPLLLLGVGYWAARRSRRTSDQRLIELAAVTALASILGLARLTLALSPYLFLWRGATAVFLVAASSWAIANFVERAVAPSGGESLCSCARACDGLRFRRRDG